MRVVASQGTKCEAPGAPALAASAPVDADAQVLTRLGRMGELPLPPLYSGGKISVFNEMRAVLRRKI